MKRYGKSAAGILGVRQTFFEENDAALRTARSQAEVYVAQPRRERCKLCDRPLPAEPDFVKLTIPYASCRECGQLNGLHEDTEAFCRAVYLDEDYAVYYGSADRERHRYRVDAVYRPKADFLAEALAADGVDLADLACADFGSGSGYFVAALLDAGAKRCEGLEVSPHQTVFARAMTPAGDFRLLDLADTVAAARTLDADMVSMIGVLEHLREPRAVLQALCDNPRPRYLFLCLPLFSLCVFLETAFPNVYPRHLVTDHTHLFTPRSIAWMERAFGLTPLAEWWFGSDMIDLYRHVLVTLSRNPATAGMADAWTDVMRPLIDPLQLELDMRHLCSEVHVVLRIER